MVVSLLMTFCLMLIEMEHVVISLRRRHHTSRMVIGTDLNVSLAPNLEGLTGSRIHPKANGAPTRWREAVTEWMHSLRLRAFCTFDYENTGGFTAWDYEEKWTHKNSNKGGKYQLDYLLVSDLVQGEASVVRGYELGSDHRPLTRASIWFIRRYGEQLSVWIIAERMVYKNRGVKAELHEGRGQGPLLDEYQGEGQGLIVSGGDHLLTCSGRRLRQYGHQTMEQPSGPQEKTRESQEYATSRGCSRSEKRNQTGHTQRSRGEGQNDEG